FSICIATLRYLGERLLAELAEVPGETLSLPFADEPAPERALDLVERIFYLRRLGGFSRSNVNALTALSRTRVERRFELGEVGLRAGEPARAWQGIVSGRLACATPDGKRFCYGPGTIAGGIETLADRPRWFTATAETKLVTLEGDTDRLFDV